MKYQSGPTDGARGQQLGLDMEFPSAQSSAPAASSVTSDAPQKSSVVVDLTAILKSRAGEADRSLIDAVQRRASHLTDCLRK
jgi:hypothetical protein